MFRKCAWVGGVCGCGLLADRFVGRSSNVSATEEVVVAGLSKVSMA